MKTFFILHWIVSRWAAVALLAGFAFGFALSPQQAEAGVIVKERATYYNVSGHDGVSLAKSIARGGKRAIPIRHAIAAAKIKRDVKNFKSGLRRGRCVVLDVDIVLNIKYIYPKWRGKSRASKKLQRAWDAFFSELVRHEKKHGDIERKAAKNALAAIKRTTGRVSRDCKDYAKKVLGRLKSIDSRAERAHRQFDKREQRLSSRSTRTFLKLIEAD